MRFRKTILFLLFSASFFVMSCSQGDPIFHDSNGQTVQKVDLRGKWVIVNYWAAWCGPCHREIPELNDLYKQMTNENVLIYGVNFDQIPPAELKKLIVKMKIKFPVLLEDPKEAWNLEGLTVLPTTFIINPEGKVVKALAGGVTAEILATVLKQLQQNG